MYPDHDRTMTTDPTPLRQAARRLQAGGVVAFPTETVYGLGANALNATAVARIFELKRRPRFDPLIVHVASVAHAQQVASAWPETAAQLAEHFWPGPLTLVLPKADAVPEIVTSGLPTIALRMPAHPLALQLITTAGLPIAAPAPTSSARSVRPAPRTSASSSAPSSTSCSTAAPVVSASNPQSSR